ncbi:MAG: hypothetical protein VX453_11730 [Acidobacteriota bacterium]|nr:hypothetical protein [Acidobacteriota bacterium]
MRSWQLALLGGRLSGLIVMSVQTNTVSTPGIMAGCSVTGPGFPWVRA